MASSSQVHVPETYPDKIPSSLKEFSDSDLDATDYDYEDGSEECVSSDSEGDQLEGPEVEGQVERSEVEGQVEGSEVEGQVEGSEVEGQVEESEVEESQSEEDRSHGKTYPDCVDPDKLPSMPHSFSSSSMITHLSSAANISSILDSFQALPSTTQDEQKSSPELLSDVHALCIQMKAYEDKILGLEAQLAASNAHCMLVHHELGDIWTQLDNVKTKKTHGSTKIKACFLTHPELKEAFEKEEIKHWKQEQINAKEAQKTQDVAECIAQINKDSILKTFEYPFSHYKKKDDLITIASALRLLTEGTITTLLA
ncbi:hypothetical protein H2248_006153 [Termitomyces sp. 'cryptogamus']|nr:hypothetical protein H2248_006153 [Termitomyces sp. 'cryptogamus']